MTTVCHAGLLRLKFKVAHYPLTDALNYTTSFSYDGAGDQISVKDANQNLTQYQYDTLNRQIKVIYPDQTFSATAYDVLGRVASKTGPGRQSHRLRI